VQEALKMLKPERRSTYSLLLQVAFAVSTVFNGDAEGLELFQGFSKGLSKYDPSRCAKVYAESQGKLGIGSVIHWLREDRPDVAEQIDGEAVSAAR